jgi:SEC-C motif-containing protein
LIAGQREAKTAEALMRSRYVAYVQQKIAYLRDTRHPSQPFDEQGARQWAAKSQWVGLEVLASKAGGSDDSEGVVEFRAHYLLGGERHVHHERSRFCRHEGKWVYLDGKTPPAKKPPTVGRNDPCPCGSKKKYKRCCGA